MVGSMSRGNSDRKADSHKRVLGKCSSKGHPTHVIDVDSFSTPDVIIIDAPDSSESTSPGVEPSEQWKTQAYENVIWIIDDDEDDCMSSQSGFEHSGHQSGDSTSSNGSQNTTNWSKKSPLQDQSFVTDSAHKQGTHSPTSSYTRGSCSQKYSSIKQQKLSPCMSLENSDSDCEIMEGNWGNTSCVWARVSSKKKIVECTWRTHSDAQVEIGAKRFSTEFGKSSDIGKTTELPNSTSYNNDCSRCGNLIPPVSTDSSTQFENTKELTGENSVIGKRELLKKTEFYQRAQEEEWAARQRELRIQAEEVQRLRKRKKAENRLLEMEKRQKERVEEVREANKKEEETLNLKEHLRSQVRRELHALEANCKDMETLLCSLGIAVGGSSCPSSNEVHAAYKRALLRFHPDRAPRTDIRQQIEAEEKFKLISRAKERFML